MTSITLFPSVLIMKDKIMYIKCTTPLTLSEFDTMTREKNHVSINAIIKISHTNIQSSSHHGSKKTCMYKHD